MAKTNTKTNALTPGAAILRLREQPFDLESVAALVPGKVATQNEVARAFGMSPSTIKGSWQSAGMPGTHGNYNLAEIALWRLRHLEELDRKRRSVEDLDDAELKRRHAEAEARKLELQADRLEREEEQAMGNLVRRDSVTAAQKALIATFAERLVGIPDKLAPMLPTETSAELTEDIRGEISRALKALAESSSRDVL